MGGHPVETLHTLPLPYLQLLVLHLEGLVFTLEVVVFDHQAVVLAGQLLVESLHCLVVGHKLVETAATLVTGPPHLKENILVLCSVLYKSPSLSLLRGMRALLKSVTI